MEIFVVVAFVSSLYLIIAYSINKENSKYLLAGYNTMSNDDRKKFDINNFFKFFKYFFKLQSLLSILIFVIFKLLVNEKIALIFYSIFLIFCPLYMIIKSKKFYKR